MGVDVFIESSAAIDQVRSTLKGPVLHILAAGIPDIKRLPRARAYDMLLGDLALLEKSFAYFRGHRDQFKAVLVDAEQHPVDGDSQPLSCGRSLNEVVAMVVRSAAYRHFKTRLDGGRALPARAAAKPSLLAAFLPFVGSAPQPVHRPKSKAKALYQAIREYLLYEWQIPLVPTYSQLTPGEVVKLGPRIADLKSVDEIMLATGRPRAKPAPSSIPSAGSVPNAAASEPPAAPPPVQEPRIDLPSLLTEDGKSLWVETLSRTLRDPEVVQLADNGEQPAHIKAALKAVGRDMLQCLVEDLSLDKRQLTVCLMRAQAILPRTAFDQLVRSGINSPALVKLVAMARRQKIGPHATLQQCADFITGQFARPHAPPAHPTKPAGGV